MARKKRHHTIPRCYLEGFTDKDGFVWVLDSTNKIFKTKPENILVESDFYTLTLKNGEKSLLVEDTLANIEGAYANIFKDKILTGQTLTDEERATVSVFLAAMYHRTKPNRESMRGMFQKLKDGLMEWKKQFQGLTPKAREASKHIPQSKGETITMEDIEDELENLDERHSLGVLDQLPSTAQMIFDMKWAILQTTKTEQKFVTSENPLTLVRPEAIKKYGLNTFGSTAGFLHKDVELTIPLSQDHILLAGWILEDNSYLPIGDDREFDNLNVRAIAYSSDKVIASNKAQLDAIEARYKPVPKVQK